MLHYTTLTLDSFTDSNNTATTCLFLVNRATHIIQWADNTYGHIVI